MKNIFTILKSMFSSNEETANKYWNETMDDSSSIITNRTSEKYIPNANDIRIIAGNATLIITDNKSIGGLWAGVSNYDPCSGSEQECFAAMRNLISGNFEEACEALIFKLDENLFLLNIADCQNRRAYDEDGLFYLHLCDDKIGVFYPIIRNFIETNSIGKKFGVTICFGGGTSIGLCSLVYKLKEDGFSYYVLGTTLPFPKKKKESWAERRGKSIDNFEYFDCAPYIDKSKSLKKFYEEDIEVIFAAMKTKVKEILSSYLESEERHDTINKENKIDKPDVLTHEAKLPERVLQVNGELDHSLNNGSVIKQTELRRHNGVVRPNYTPNAISSLKEDEVFVFGSNLYGHHSGGAARVARKQFGAIWGQGVGLQCQSYAIPTMQGGVETIKPYVDQFIGFAREHAELFFYVTRIGCGIAGFKDRDIAPLFKDAMAVDNICLPESFVNILKDSTCTEMPHAPKSYKMMMYGQCRTFADIIKTLNEQKHYHSFEELFPDFGEVIEKYQQRGAYCQDSLDVMERVLHNYKDELFEGNRFHMDSFVEKLEMTFDDKDKSEIDLIFVNRQRAKLLILLKTLNDICHYTDVEDLRYHLLSVATGRWNCGDNSNMNDPLPRKGNWPINWFLSGLQEQWNNVTVNGELDNQLLEQVMFTSHTNKVREMGIEQVIANDFTADGPCHPEVFYPKNPGTAPVYVKDEFSRRYLKACGEGKGPRSGHELYEMELVKSVLRQEVSKGHYELLGGRYYIPVGTIKKPVFIEYWGRVHFASLNEKRRFIDKVRRENKGC